MVNEWWSGSPDERFWMEITNRRDLGANLWAPQLDDSGREYWSYSLVGYTRPGDLVLHWSKQAGPAIVGYSQIDGEVQPSMITWQSRGTYGRQRDPSGDEPGWLVPLRGTRSLSLAVSQERLRELEQEVRRVRDRLDNSVTGPVYFPFALSSRRPLRAAQGYLTKFPRDLVAAVPELNYLLDLARAGPGDTAERDDNIPRGGASRPQAGGRQKDVEARLAIERYAVLTVAKWYSELGYDVENVGAYMSWDLTARRDSEEIHIEVKGSAGAREGVDLTEGEVRNAEDHQPTDLAVVDDIGWTRTPAGIKCSGGRVRRWPFWTPDRSALVATSYRYPLPRSDNQP